MLQINLYGGARSGAFFADGMAGGGGTDLTARRAVPALGAGTNADTSGWMVGAAARGGVVVPIPDGQVQLAATLAYDRIGQGAVLESPGPASLSVDSGSATSLRSLLAASAQTHMALGERMVLRPSATLGWSHEFADTAARTSAAFLSAPGSGFTVIGAHFGRNAAILGASLALDHAFDTPVSLYVAYTASLASGGTAQSISGGLRMTW